MKGKNKGKESVSSSYEDSTAIVHGNCCDDFVLVVELSKRSNDRWILDSGSSFHVTPHRHWFSTYDCVQGGVVHMGNNAMCNIVGVGSMRIRMFDGMIYNFLNVHHVSDMKKNLISLGALVSDGSRCILDKDGLEVTNGFQVVMKGKKKSSFYELLGLMDDGLAKSKGSLLSDEHIFFCGI